MTEELNNPDTEGDKNWKEMREKLNLYEAKIAEYEGKERQEVFKQAGLDTTKGVGKAVEMMYEGDLTVEGIQQYASEEFKVEFGSKNIQITPAGIEVEDRQSCIVGGHHHLIINNAYDVDKNIMEPIPHGANILHFGSGQTEAVLSLNPGKYTLQLAAGDHEHRPIKPFGASKEYKPVSSKKITIEILPN